MKYFVGNLPPPPPPNPEIYPLYDGSAPPPPPPTRHTLSYVTINEDDVVDVLRKLNAHIVMGSDAINNQLLKLKSRPITPSLTKLFNRCIRNYTFPSSWKDANPTPIYKKGPKTDKSNYRPISLLPAGV